MGNVIEEAVKISVAVCGCLFLLAVGFRCNVRGLTYEEKPVRPQFINEVDFFSQNFPTTSFTFLNILFITASY
jgi:hypothetical protein